MAASEGDKESAMTRKTWWVARGNTSGHYYLAEEKYGTPTGHGEFLRRVGTHKMVNDLWDALSVLRLSPGEGPVQVTLEVKVRRVR